MDVERRLNALQIRRIAVEVSENQRLVYPLVFFFSFFFREGERLNEKGRGGADY